MADNKVHTVRGKKKKKVAFKAPSKTTDDREVKEQILDRVAREEKAYRIVERMLDNPVSCELLQKSLQFINQSVYNDIVEERSIIKNCGYPPCGNTLPAVIKKQIYAINAKLNKVYKMEERVKFCSAFCFNCSRNLRDQLSDAPVWLVPHSAHESIVIVPAQQELNSAPTKEEALPKNLKIDDKHLKLNSNVEPGVIKEQICSTRNNTVSKSNATLDIRSTLDAQFAWLDLADSDSDSESPTNRTSKPEISVSETVKHCLLMWKTPHSSAYIKQMRSCESDEESHDDESDDLLDEDLKVNAPPVTLPIPDRKSLDNTSFRIGEVKEPVTKISLPRVDSVNQTQQRQSIVMQKVQLVIVKLLSSMSGCEYSDFSDVIIKLIALFDIQSSNCMFSEKQWLAIGAVILANIHPVTPALNSKYSMLQFLEILWSQVETLFPERADFEYLCNILR